MKRRAKKSRLCQLPSPGNIAGRSSSITNAFFNAIIPIHEPTEEEELEALALLGMEPGDVRCAYCGDKSTEWDHLRPIITDQRPTGYITEIANLVPACGKCNQSKGKSKWNEWMLSSAPLSPKSRGVLDVHERAEKLAIYSAWKPPTRVDFEGILSQAQWEQHTSNWRRVLDLMQESQKFAQELRNTIENAPRYRNPVTGETFYGRSGPERKRSTDTRTYTTEEVVARLDRHRSLSDAKKTVME